MENEDIDSAYRLAHKSYADTDNKNEQNKWKSFRNDGKTRMSLEMFLLKLFYANDPIR